MDEGREDAAAGKSTEQERTNASRPSGGDDDGDGGCGGLRKVISGLKCLNTSTLSDDISTEKDVDDDETKRCCPTVTRTAVERIEITTMGSAEKTAKDTPR